MTKTSTRYSPEVRERAVRLVLDHQTDHPSRWPAIESIAPKIGCSSATLCKWVRRSERDAGQRAGPTSDDLARLKALKRENRELRQANEILRKASVSFAQAELDRPMKKCEFAILTQAIDAFCLGAIAKRHQLERSFGKVEGDRAVLVVLMCSFHGETLTCVGS